MSDLERLLAEEGEHAEVLRDMDPPADAKPTRPGRERAKVLSIHLAPDEYDRLTEAAQAHGVGPSTYARGLILQGMQPTEQLAERVSRLERLIETGK